MYFYSKSTGGFYTTDIHGENIPDDAVEVSSEQYTSLLTAQSAGKLIVPDEAGHPIAIFPPQPVRTKTMLLADVAAKRWSIETGGIFVSDCLVATDREAQAQLSNSYLSLKSGLIADTPWKSADGHFTLVTLSEIEPIAQAVASHVRACFAAEQAHHNSISSLATQADIDSYDINTGWPVNLISSPVQ